MRRRQWTLFLVGWVLGGLTGCGPITLDDIPIDFGGINVSGQVNNSGNSGGSSDNGDADPSDPDASGGSHDPTGESGEPDASGGHDDPHGGGGSDPHDPRDPPGDGHTDEGEADPPAPPDEAGDQTDLLELRPYIAPGLGSPHALVASANMYLPLAVDAVIRAGVLANGGTALVTVGTLTQVTPQQFTYATTPNDRLRLELLDGRSAEFYFDSVVGDFTGDGQTFLSGAHELGVRIVIENVQDVEYTSSLQNMPGRFYDYQRRFSARGRFVYDALAYDGDVQAEGTHYFENDQTGFEESDDLRYQGTIMGQHSTIQVDETWQFRNVGAEIDGEYSVSSSVARRVDNAWSTVRGEEYRCAGALIQSAFRDGIPQDPDFWQATGRLLRDGAEYGYLELTGDNDFIRAVLVLPEGRMEVQSWPTRND